MDIDLELFKIFDAVAATSSFSAAANRLYISQPAVSQAIRRMEEQLGVTLFIRGRRGVTLTPEGDIIYGYVHTALKMIETGVQHALQRNALHDTELRIAAGDTTAKWYLMPIIREFNSLYPSAAINLVTGISSEIITMLNEQQIDIGFVNMPCSANGIIFEECLTIHDIFIAGKKYEHLRSREISLQELTTYPLIMLDSSTSSRKWVDRHFTSHGATISSNVVFDSHDLLADYVKADMGIACVVEEFSRNVLTDTSIFKIELEHPVPERSIGICFRDDAALSPSVEEFIKLAKLRS